jgi:hypothetical protein
MPLPQSADDPIRESEFKGTIRSILRFRTGNRQRGDLRIEEIPNGNTVMHLSIALIAKTPTPFAL